MNVFRTATTQAIRDIIADHGTANRFGLSLTDADIDAICTRVVDLFEMTLNLRAQVGGGGLAESRRDTPANPNAPQALKSGRWEEDRVSVPRTKAASEIYDFSHLEKRSRADALPQVAPQNEEIPDLKLPRKRISVSSDEREVLLRRAQSPSVAVTQST
ncbi:MAG: hypothetical protein EBR09_13220 [Proteobacteria bacterium]|nr:hypothetical protein [Pseudomonadota bacterium]